MLPSPKELLLVMIMAAAAATAETRDDVRGDKDGAGGGGGGGGGGGSIPFHGNMGESPQSCPGDGISRCGARKFWYGCQEIRACYQLIRMRMVTQKH